MWCEAEGYQLLRVKEEVYLQDKEQTISLLTEAINKGEPRYLELY